MRVTRDWWGRGIATGGKEPSQDDADGASAKSRKMWPWCRVMLRKLPLSQSLFLIYEMETLLNLR